MIDYLLRMTHFAKYLTSEKTGDGMLFYFLIWTLPFCDLFLNDTPFWMKRHFPKLLMNIYAPSPFASSKYLNNQSKQV